MDLLNNIKEPPKIRVVVRKRPLTKKELARNDTDVLEIIAEDSLIVREMKTKVDLTKFLEEHHFTFDNAFDSDADNQVIYQECVLPLVVEAFKGAKTTCFAYGQTGSGKTFTMMGTPDGSVPGLYLLATYDVVELLNQYEDLELYLSFYEIYCGKLFDLLNSRTEVQCREDAKQKVNIIGLTEKQITNAEDIMRFISAGLQSRTSGSTGANAESSRSHAILQMQLKHYGKPFGKLSFIDLAGSERGADTMNTSKQTKLDGAEINKSLLALKECIRALDLEKKHLPFRGSKLTQVLKDSFTGNSKTTMVANVSPAGGCCEHTLNTLRYADRVKELKKDPATGGGAEDKPKVSKQEKELGLARTGNNVKKVAINQATGKPKSENQPPTKGPTLKGAQPQLQQQQQPPQTSFNNFMGAINKEVPAQQNQPNKRPHSMMLDQAPQNNLMKAPVARQQQQQQQQMQQQQQQPVYQQQKPGAPQNPYSYKPGMKNKQSSDQLDEQFAMFEQVQQQRGADNMRKASMRVGGQNQFGQNQQNQMGLRPPQHPQNNNYNQQQQQHQSFQTPQQHSNSFYHKSNPNQNLANNRVSQQYNPSPKQAQPNKFNFQQQPQQNRPQTAQNNQKQMSSAQQQLNKMSFQKQGHVPQNFNKKGGQIQQQKAAPSMPQLGEGIPTYEELEKQYANDVDTLCNDHEQLIEQILEEEEQLIQGHRKHIDDIVDLVKNEMTLLNEVDKPGSDVETYVKDLDQLLIQKINMIQDMRKQVITFHTHLKTEEVMSKLYQQQQDLNDLENAGSGGNDYGDENLLGQDMEDDGQLVEDIDNQVEDMGYGQEGDDDEQYFYNQ